VNNCDTIEAICGEGTKPVFGRLTILDQTDKIRMRSRSKEDVYGTTLPGNAANPGTIKMTERGIKKRISPITPTAATLRKGH